MNVASITPEEWDTVWKNWIANGSTNRKQIDMMVFAYPKMSNRAIAATIGCSHQAVANRKRRLLFGGK